MLAPVLAFTADEAWEFVPGKVNRSVHETVSEQKPFVLPPNEQAKWVKLFELREQGLMSLEQARRAQTIGKALEAKLNVIGPKSALETVADDSETLRELLNVSSLHYEFSDADKVLIGMAKADGQKCERCWHWETDVGSNSEHSTICARCVEAVKACANQTA
jgi:isoleucyl-tRNA synthetase